MQISFTPTIMNSSRRQRERERYQDRDKLLASTRLHVQCLTSIFHSLLRLRRRRQKIGKRSRKSFACRRREAIAEQFYSIALLVHFSCFVFFFTFFFLLFSNSLFISQLSPFGDDSQQLTRLRLFHIAVNRFDSESVCVTFRCCLLADNFWRCCRRRAAAR